MRLNKTEYSYCAVSDVFFINLGNSSWSHWKWLLGAEMAFHPYTTEDSFHHKTADIHPVHLPLLQQIQHQTEENTPVFTQMWS